MLFLVLLPCMDHLLIEGVVGKLRTELGYWGSTWICCVQCMTLGYETLSFLICEQDGVPQRVVGSFIQEIE